MKRTSSVVEVQTDHFDPKEQFQDLNPFEILALIQVVGGAGGFCPKDREALKEVIRNQVNVLSEAFETL